MRLSLLVTLLSLLALPALAERVVDEEAGLSFEYPFPQYSIEDMSQGRALVHMYSTPDGQGHRVVIISLPKAMFPEGMADRRESISQVGGDGYTEHRFEAADLAGLQGHALEYSAQGLRALEIGAIRGDALVIIQVAAPVADWNNPDQAAQLRAAARSVEFLGEERPAAEAIEEDLSTADDVRAEWPDRAAPDWRIAAHDVRLRVNPAEGSVEVEDDFVVEALADGVEAIQVATSVVEEVRFDHEGEGLAVATTEPDEILSRHGVTLPEPLSVGDTITLTYRAKSADYFQNVPNQLVAEVSVLGQVREASSYSSHVVYYPIDPTGGGNDATVSLSISVPEGYVVAAGGEAAGQETVDGWTTYRFRNDLSIPRLLPFGWAIARYIQHTATTTGGTRIDWYGYEGEEPLLEQRMEVALEAAETFEDMMGPLPWGRIAFAHVSPEEREMGVSTPGLIMISDEYFDDFGDLDLAGRSVNDPAVLDPLVVVDELSHQWNAYAVSLPNELAEGVATFLDLLWLGEQAGEDTYRQGMRELAEAYIQSRSLGEDVPVASPRVYESPIYRSIAFAKVAVVMDMLMRYLGRERFFAAWSAAFSELHGQRPTYDEFFQALSGGAGEDLTWFEEQWLLRSGLPRIRAAFRGDDIILEQVQPQEPFRLPSLEVRVIPNQGDAQVLSVSMDGRDLAVPSPVDVRGARLEIDPEGLLLVEQVGHAD
jgi:coenzyme F420-reducing hydrogenase delta subunit